MARSELRPVVTLRSTAGTGRSHVTRKNRGNGPDRLELRKFDSAAGRHVLFREVSRPCAKAARRDPRRRLRARRRPQ